MNTMVKLTEHTLIVNVLDMEKLNHDLNDAVHSNHPEDKQIYKARARLALVTEPKLGVFDYECVGQEGDTYELAVYGEGEENGNRYFEAIPRYAFKVPINWLQKYIKEVKTLVEFMGDNYRPNHHRIGNNIRSWLKYFNGED